VNVPKVELVVLGLLAEEPMHGYDLLERFRSRSMGFWVEVGKASVYQALSRLEKRGLVVGRAREGTEGPDRRVYRITRSGRARLAAGLEERFAELAPVWPSVMSRDARLAAAYETEAGTALGFVHLLAPAEARAAVTDREQAVTDLLDAVDTERARVAAERGAGRMVANALLDRQEALAKAELVWLKAFRASLGKLRR
jgi:DNA-binding PadR family transcriptional regulator